MGEDAFSPLAVRPVEGDFIDDDLPTDTGYLGSTRNGKPTRNTTTSDDRNDGIEVICSEPFELFVDHFEKLGQDALRYVKQKYVLENGCHCLSNSRLMPTHCRPKMGFSLDAKNCNLKMELYEGFDWSSTRSLIKSERQAVRRRLLKIQQMLASGQTAQEELANLNSLIFDSVHLGITQDSDLENAADLTAAIDSQLDQLQEEGLDRSEEWQNLSNHGPPKGDAPVSFDARLERSARPHLEIKFWESHCAMRSLCSPRVPDFLQSLICALDMWRLSISYPHRPGRSFSERRLVTI